MAISSFDLDRTILKIYKWRENNWTNGVFRRLLKDRGWDKWPLSLQRLQASICMNVAELFVLSIEWHSDNDVGQHGP